MTDVGAEKVVAVKGEARARGVWEMPEKTIGGRRWVVGVVLVGMVVMFGCVIGTFYAGAQGGVDQAGYLMTARLMAGDKNVGGLEHPAATMEHGRDAHAMPHGAQTWSSFEWLRNRLSFVPESPFQFASRMCVMTEPYGPASATQPAEYRVYAKYPPGYSAMAAVARKAWGFAGMYMVDPFCTVLACFVAYFMFRQVVGAYMSLLGVLWLMCNPLVLFYANDANSHSAALLCLVVGFWGLLSWMKTGAVWRAWVGGFALGYACTVRYSEFLLVLPVLFAAAVQFRPTWKRALGSLSLVAAWAIPVATLAFVCWVSFGAPWKTGYSYCKESTGFGWKYLSGMYGEPGTRHVGNWETFVQQINSTALFVFWAPAVVGLFAMLTSSWRLGVTILLWVMPQTILYMLYYWAPGGENTVSYMRFFMTLMPGFILAALWGLERGLAKLPGEKWPGLVVITGFGVLVLLSGAFYFYGENLRSGWGLVGQVFAALGLMVISWKGLLFALVMLGILAGIWWKEREAAAGRVTMALSAGVITALGCAVNVNNIMPQVESLYTQSVGLRATIDNTRALLPKGSVLFGDDNLLNQMDCVGDWKLVNARLFSPMAFQESLRRYETIDKDKDEEDDPDPLQRERSKFYMELLGKKNDKGVWVPKPSDELWKFENDLIDRYFAEGRRVAFLVQESDARSKRGRVMVPNRKDCDVKELGRWCVQPPVAGTVVMGGRLGRFAQPPRAGVAARPGKVGGCYVLYELTKKRDEKGNELSAQELALREKAARDREREKRREQRRAEQAATRSSGREGELFPDVPAR